MDLSSFPPIATLIVIVGLILIIVALVQITGKWTVKPINSIIVFVVGVILVFSGIHLAGSSNFGLISQSIETPTPTPIVTSTPVATPTQTPVEVSFTYPSNLASVKITETLIGTARDIPKGQQLWIAIYPQNAYKFYPQNPVDTQSDGSWTLPVQFGGESNAGVKYDIVAVLADKNAQKELNNYMDASAKNESYPGMRMLPNGTMEITRITVTRV